jgi:putative nucleotidyltransferase with HDIG domain
MFDQAATSVRWATGGPPVSSRRATEPSAACGVFPGPPSDATPLEIELARRLRTGRIALPVLPEIATIAMRLARERDLPIDAIVDLVHRDPVLAARFLAAAGAPDVSRGEPLTTIRAAVGELGLLRARDLLDQIGYAAAAGAPTRHGDELEASFRRSVRCAQAAQAIALKIGASAESAYLIGLLHDLGEARVLRALGDCTEASPGPREVRRLVGRWHEPAGAQLATAWRLPAAVVATCTHHHGDPEGASPEQLLAMASDAVVDASTSSLTAERRAVLTAIRLGAVDVRSLVARFAPGRDREE